MNRNSLTLYVLAILVIATVVWAHFTQIDISVEARGMVRPEGEVIHVNSEVRGKIMRANVREGEDVHSGDTLVQLDTSAIALKQRVLEARIQAAEIRMEQLRRNAPKSSPLDSQMLDAARLDLLSLYQQLEQSEMDRSLLTITSPADGVISSIVALHPGEVVAEGAAIATIIPSDRNLIVEAWLPTKDRPRIHEGQTARVQPEEALADPSGTFDGIVLSVSPDVRLIDSRAAYRVVVAPLDEAPALRLGMTFRIYFITRQERLLMVLFHRLQAGLSN